MKFFSPIKPTNINKGVFVSIDNIAKPAVVIDYDDPNSPPTAYPKCYLHNHQKKTYDNNPPP